MLIYLVEMEKKTLQLEINRMDSIKVIGARVHNLKNINVSIPRKKITVITGLSGSGKSSLAFDTIFAEGQRRYIETFSSYSRNFLVHLERPDVDEITGLSPVISIDQKTTNKNPRSTVGTVTEIYDFLRLLYAKIGEAYSYVTGEKMIRYTEEQLLDKILKDYTSHNIYMLSPLVRNRKGHYRELFETMRRKGFLFVRVDGTLLELEKGLKVDRYKNHEIELVVDRLKIEDKNKTRIKKSLSTALLQGEGQMSIMDLENNEVRHYSKNLMCPSSGIAYSDPAPHNFSFNSKTGACPKCKGLGYINVFDIKKIVPNTELSIYEGGLLPLGKNKNVLIFWEIEAILEKYGCNIKTPIRDIPQEAMDDILNGTNEKLRISAQKIHSSNDYFVEYDGLVKYIQQIAERDSSASAQKWVDQFSVTKTCPLCNGARLNIEALHYRIENKNIFDLSSMDIKTLSDWFSSLRKSLGGNRATIARDIIEEISKRLDFLKDVGLGYLSLNRSSQSLSGGESQRIRLATQIGSQLVNVLYILDEPSIGLHQRDNIRLINSLKKLRDLGNTIIVVEHDKDMMLNSDYVIDMGPGAGRLGGTVLFEGDTSHLLKSKTLTSKYLTGEEKIPFSSNHRKGNGYSLFLHGASGNNLKDVDVELPLGKFICITGVSGSGKSTLINETLLPIISQRLYRSLKEPLSYKSIENVEMIDKVVNVDQSPLGRTPRSNPATYTGVFSDIRSLFSNLPEAQLRGYKSGRFSFNVNGGRCEVCKGNGYKVIEMNFMPDVFVPCECCHGNRYNRETLEVKYKGKSIADVLDMTINQAVEFFANIPSIYGKIKVLQDVGLGYVKLGQSSTTLSGGESQRVKLATELSKRDTGKTLYILDEPTTGLHFEDIRVLSKVLNQLVDKGNTVIVIEHNLDLIKQADYIIDMGPEGGEDGGTILCSGTPEEIVQIKKGYTWKYLQQEIQNKNKYK